MRIIKDLAEMFEFSQRKKNHGKTLGFVPTMGALHDGHLSLVQAAKQKADVVVVSIFVNPIQFAANEDFSRYPKTLSHDKKQLSNFEVDVLFLPEADKLFPKGFKSFVEVGELSSKMCGRSRPTHFRGVTTVLAKLFNVVCPTSVFMGLKDFQQQLIVKAMVKDLNYPLEIIPLPTVREYDGLAMSSRNKLLSSKERELATIIYKALSLAKEEIEKGEKDLRKINVRLRSLLGTVPSLRLDYLVIVDPVTLEEVKALKGQVMVALAAHLGNTRLIDSMLIKAS